MPDFDMTGLMPDTEEALLKSTMGEAMKVAPDTHAKNMDISKMSGVPVDLVSKDPKGIEHAANKQNFDMTGLMERSPETSKFLTNYDQAAIAHDDTGNLEGIEKALSLTLYGIVKPIRDAALDITGVNPEDVASNMHKVLVGDMLNVIDGTRLANIEAQQRRFGIGDVEDINDPIIQQMVGRQETAAMKTQYKLLEDIHQRNKVMETLEPKDMNVITEGARGAIRSVAHFAEAATVAGLTRSGQFGVLTAFGVQTYAQSYGDARTEGLEPDAAVAYATIQAGIEVGTEIMPVGALVDVLKTGLKTDATRKVIGFMVKEMGTEQIATLGQSINDYLFGLDEQMEKADSIGEMAEIQGRRQVVTLIAAGLGGGLQIGAAATIAKAGEVMQSDDQQLQTKHQTEQVSLDKLVELAEESKVKQRSPEQFKQFIDGVVGKDLNVHLDAVQASLYLQEVGQEVIDGDTFLTGLQQKLQGEAELTGDISLPVAEFMTDIAGSDHFEALRSATTLSSETLAMVGENKVEAEQNVANQIHMRSIVEAEAKKIENLEQIKAVMATAREQLVATGRVDENAASALAEMVAGYVAQTGATSNSINETLQQVYTRMGLDIQGVVKDEVTETEIVLPPSSFAKEQNFGELTTEEQAIDEFGDSVTITQNVQTEWDRLAKRRNVTQTLVDCLNNG